MAEPQGVQEKSGIACPEARLQESARGTGRLLKLCGIHGFAGQAALGEGKRHSIKVASACSCSPPSPCRSTWPPPSRRLPPSPRTGQDRSRAASASPEAPWPPAAVGLAAGPAWGSGAQAPLGLCPACSRRSGPGREGGREGGPAGLPLCLLLPSSPPCPGGVGLACLQEQRLLGGVCFWSCSLWTVELWRADVAFGSPPLSHSAWVLNGPFGWVSVACGGPFSSHVCTGEPFPLSVLAARLPGAPEPFPRDSCPQSGAEGLCTGLVTEQPAHLMQGFPTWGRLSWTSLQQ